MARQRAVTIKERINSTLEALKMSEHKSDKLSQRLIDLCYDIQDTMLWLMAILITISLSVTLLGCVFVLVHLVFHR